jgi:hypothetical protein
MNSTTNGGDAEIVPFPKTAAEREAIRKARQDIERQRLIDVFIDEPNGLFTTDDGTAFADLIMAGHRETWPIRSRQFRYAYTQFLRRRFEELSEAGAIQAIALGACRKKAAINAAIDEFEMQASCSRLTRDVHVRVGSGDGGDIFIDLCDADWHAVRVTGSGWTIVQNPPMRFRRSAGMLPLPFPERGTSIDRLRPFLNCNASDFVLVLAFLLAALRPGGPYPVLALFGEQGTAKTTFLRVLRRLIDPNAVPSTPLPGSGRDLFITAANSYALTFENVSTLSGLMSDNLCRLATGGGFRMRALFKDSDEALFRAARPIMLEGIATFITRADLMDRAIILPLEPLVDRKTERVLRAEFEDLRPGLFGALLDHLVTGIRQLPDTHLASIPRMLDFATFSVACGLDGFEQAYAANRQAAIDVALEHDMLARAVRALAAQRGAWEGTASELLDLLGPTARIATAKALSDELSRAAPLLRTVGIEVRHHRTATRRGITITARRQE